MAEKKKGKKRKEEYVAPGEEVIEKPSKDEYAVAKWLRKNVPIKKTKFLNHNVEYFTASKAVDGLMTSKWAQGDDPKFPTRLHVVDFLDTMLRHKFFHRARKVPVSEQELKARAKKDKKPKDETEEKKKDDNKGTDAESSHVEGKQETAVEKEKRKRKVRLEMHNDQLFVDGLDAYVWIYDPIPIYYWLFGTLLVLGAIGICLFPLWPPSVRKGVYYISVAAAGFLVFIIGLAILRVIVFCLLWMLTLGRHHLWLLPNLTEDVSFLASFWPLYKYEYKGPGSKPDNKKDKKKKKKDKDSDAENEDTESLISESPKHEKRKFSEDTLPADTPSTEEHPDELRQENEEINSESESESSQRSSTGRDFEIVDQDDIET